MRLSRLLTPFLAVALVIAAVTPSTIQAQGNAYFRAVHFLMNGPKIDVYIDGKATLKKLQYQDATPEIPLTPGKHVINFSIAGKGSANPATELPIDATDGDLFTLVFSGTLAGNAPTIFLTSESGLAKSAKITPDPTMTMPLLFIQSVGEIGAVDVYVNDMLAGTASLGTPVVAEAPFGPYKVLITAAGDKTKVLANGDGVSFNMAVGVLGLTGTVDKPSLDDAYSTWLDAGKFFAAQTSLPVSFDSLTKAVMVANLDKTLSGPGPMTILAPVDTAFAAVQPSDAIDTLEADPALIGNVVKYHIIGEYLSFNDITALVTSKTIKKTLNGQYMTFKPGNQGITFGGTLAMIMPHNIHTTNAVIQPITAVLMPPTP